MISKQESTGGIKPQIILELDPINLDEEEEDEDVVILSDDEDKECVKVINAKNKQFQQIDKKRENSDSENETGCLSGQVDVEDLGREIKQEENANEQEAKKRGRPKRKASKLNLRELTANDDDSDTQRNNSDYSVHSDDLSFDEDDDKDEDYEEVQTPSEASSSSDDLPLDDYYDGEDVYTPKGARYACQYCNKQLSKKNGLVIHEKKCRLTSQRCEEESDAS